MDAEDKKLLHKHTQQMAELQNDFQVFYKVVQRCLHFQFLPLRFIQITLDAFS